MRSRTVCIALAVFLLVVSSAAADTRGFGVPDTVDLVFSTIPDATTGQMQLQIDLWCFTDSTNVWGATMGFFWDNPNLTMDSAFAYQVAAWPYAFQIGPFFFDGNEIDSTNAHQRFVFAGSRTQGTGILPSDSRQLWASYFMTISDWSVDDSIVIDTMTWGSESVYKMVLAEFGPNIPYWTGRKVIHDTAWVAPKNLILTPDSLHFSAQAGGANPPMQSFDLTTDGDPVDFTLVESLGWLQLSPIQGTTPTGINVWANIVGLGEGTYVDSVRVDAPNADNAPQWLKVSLTLDPPPPTIDATPDALYFNAIAGGADPAPKTLTIKNVGGSTLNFTLAHGESWLDLDPDFGTDSTDITVSVDITGLVYDDYEDVIIISDPTATNDPYEVPVYLSVGSDLPIIAVDSAYNTIIVDVPSPADPRTLHLYNEGAGILNYWIEEDSPRLFNIVPTSGSAPDDIVVAFKLSSATAGNDYFDTLWIHSNEAINSPFPVVYRFHVVDPAAQLQVGIDTVHLNVYECSMGWWNIDMPEVTFHVTNAGGDDPMPVSLIWESDYFTVDQSLRSMPVAVTVTAEYVPLPLGTYYDTILVTAWNAINTPVVVPVAYHVIAGTEPPVLIVSPDEIVIATQSFSGPSRMANYNVLNGEAGCMDWEIDDDIPWFYPTVTSGTAPELATFHVNSSGFPFGDYFDTLLVEAPEAANSPQPLALQMRVWMFHGDCDYNGEINVADYVYLVEYMFTGGQAPQPILVVGDMTCDHQITIEDLVYFGEYMFMGGPIPCGNPW